MLVPQHVLRRCEFRAGPTFCAISSHARILAGIRKEPIVVWWKRWVQAMSLSALSTRASALDRAPYSCTGTDAAGGERSKTAHVE